MNLDYLKFLKKASILTLCLFVIGFGVFKFLIPEHYQKVFPFLLLFYYLFGLLLQFFLYKIAKSNMMRFSGYVSAIVMLKMFVLIILAFVYTYLNKDEAVGFIVVFFLLYVIFSILEVYDIMKVVSKK